MSVLALPEHLAEHDVFAEGLPCHFVDPELFFADDAGDIELAKALCRTCPMRGACLDGALERSEPHGVWGGELFSEGVVIARKRPRGRPPKNPAPFQPVLVPVLPLPGRESPFRAA